MSFDDELTGTLTGWEILGQPEAWAEALVVVQAARQAIRDNLSSGQQVLFTGCGTSYYMAIAAARVYQAVIGRAARAVSASELVLAPEGVVGQGGPLVALSRSGETSETVLAARTHRAQGYGPVVGLTAQAGSSLADAGDLTLCFPKANDQSVVMTCSFTTLLLGAWALAAAVAGDERLDKELHRLPALAGPAIAAAAPMARELGRNTGLDRFVFLGLGAYLGLALEGMLKLKEMTQVASEAYGPMEFRHGPISVVDNRTAVVLLATEQGAAEYGAVLADIARCGGRTVAVGAPLTGLNPSWALPLGEGLSDRCRGLLYMPFLQLLALQRALALGCNPDQPRNLNRVVVLGG